MFRGSVITKCRFMPKTFRTRIASNCFLEFMNISQLTEEIFWRSENWITMSTQKILKWEFRADTTFETCGTEANSISLTNVEVERVECSAALWLQSVDSCPKLFGHALHRIVFLNLWIFRSWRRKFFDVVKIELQCPQVMAHKDILVCELPGYAWTVFVLYRRRYHNQGTYI